MPASSLFADRAVHVADRSRRFAYRDGAGARRCSRLPPLAVSLAGDSELSLFYIVAVIAAFFVLRLVAIAIMWMARRVGTIRGTTLGSPSATSTARARLRRASCCRSGSG